jgi:hypothetical protein
VEGRIVAYAFKHLSLKKSKTARFGGVK